MKRAASILLALMLVLALTACGGGDGGVKAKDGYGEGKIGDVMHSYFFDFTVNSAERKDAYESYTAQDGNQIMVINVTITNTFAKNTNMGKEDIEKGSADIEMYDTDFQLEWDGGDDAIVFPITTNPETFEELDTVSDNQLPAIYPLNHEESRTGDLVFEIPADAENPVLVMGEQFDDGSEEGQAGDMYAVILEAK